MIMKLSPKEDKKVCLKNSEVEIIKDLLQPRPIDISKYEKYPIPLFERLQKEEKKLNVRRLAKATFSTYCRRWSNNNVTGDRTMIMKLSQKEDKKVCLKNSEIEIIKDLLQPRPIDISKYEKYPMTFFRMLQKEEKKIYASTTKVVGKTSVLFKLIPIKMYFEVDTVLYYGNGACLEDVVVSSNHKVSDIGRFIGETKVRGLSAMQEYLEMRSSMYIDSQEKVLGVDLILVDNVLKNYVKDIVKKRFLRGVARELLTCCLYRPKTKMFVNTILGMNYRMINVSN
ncbi:uncharacterized protein LOC135843818 isoform X2 [Planococcus citri]